MRNICRLIKGDVRRMFSNVVSTIIAIGLVVMPSIFTWYNVIACWNVFDNTGDLTVAVANTDEGYESDLVPLRVNVGEQVVSALRANDDIDWTFTTEEDAIDGAKSGRYYAAVVIPPSFSRDMLTFYSSDVQRAQIVYYANEKKNAIAPKITDKGADSVSYQVNEVFAETLSEIALSLAEAFANYASEADLDGRIGDMSAHVRTMADDIDRTATVVALYASLADTAQTMVSGSAGLVSAAQGAASDLTPGIEQGVSSVTSLADVLKRSAADLSSALESSAAGFDEVEKSVDALFDTASDQAGVTAANMRTQAGMMADEAALYRQVADELAGLRDAVPDEYAPAIDALALRLNATADLMDEMAANLSRAADKLEAGDASVQAERAEIKRLISEARADADSAKADFDANVKPGLEKLASDVATFADSVGSGVSMLEAAGGDLSGTLESAGSVLGTSSGKISDVASSIGELSSELRELADGIDAALVSGDIEMLRDVLGSDTHVLSRALAAPVGVERIAVFPAENFGSAMAPLYTTLALFIGSLLIMVVVKPQVSERARTALDDPKPRELFLGRFGTVAFISLLQTTLMGLGNMLFLQVQVAHPLLFMLCFWVAGLVFSFFIYALVAAFANLGKAVAVLLLIVQVTGCGGSFPLQILPQFVQNLSPFLPATHVVNAMRAAMFGICGNDFWLEMGCLLLFLIPAAIIGLVLRKPLARFMEWYIERVEESKLVG